MAGRQCHHPMKLHRHLVADRAMRTNLNVVSTVDVALRGKRDPLGIFLDHRQLPIGRKPSVRGAKLEGVLISKIFSAMRRLKENPSGNPLFLQDSS
jgi:hypothetical protein